MYINSSVKEDDQALSTNEPPPATDTRALPIADISADPTKANLSAHNATLDVTYITPHFVITLET